MSSSEPSSIPAATPRAATAHGTGLAAPGAASGAGDAIPRVGVSLTGLERFAAELAAATRGLPGGYVPATGPPRRALHEHPLVERKLGGRWCNVCKFKDGGVQSSWHLCRECGYDECANCFAESERLALLPPELTTDDANKLAMAHLTGARRCAFSDLLGSDPALVGEATVFVSHSWAAPLDALVACVGEADAALRRPSHPRHVPGATPYFWVDLVVNDQFAAPSRPFAWWQTVFRESVERIGHTVVALEWESPRPLGRIWCLWEMFCSTTGAEDGGRGGGGGRGAEDGGRGGGGGSGGVAAVPRPPTLLELALPPASAAAFRRDLEDDFDSLATKLSRIDLRNADAFHGGSCRSLSGGCPAVAAGRPCPDDKAQILDAIAAAPGGVDGVTKRVIAGLRGWMVGAAREALTGIAGDDERRASLLQFKLANLLWQGGRLGNAEALMRERLEVKRRTLGGEHQNTYASIGMLATILQDQGKLAEAEPLCREALDGRRRTLGDAHPNTLTSINNLARLLQDQGKLAEAEPLFREALDGKRRTLGDAHPSTLTSIGNLAVLLYSQGKLAEAEPLYREALDGKRRTLGDAHPDTLISINSFASLLKAQGKLSEAEPLNREAINGRRRTLGDAHPDTLISINNFAGLLKAQGKLSEAEPLFREALDGLRRTLGDVHPTTLTITNNLGCLRQDQGDLAEAEALKREALAGRRRVLGDAHEHTLQSARDTADLLVTLGGADALAEAAALDAEALAGLRGKLGEAHLYTLGALRVHGRVLAAQGDHAGAAEALRASLAGLRTIGNAAEARKSARELAAALLVLGDEAGAAEAESQTH